MKKIVVLLFTIFTIFTLSACGTSVHEDLQENEWNVVATNGEAYTADFHADTVTFQLGDMFTTGYTYSLNEDETEFSMRENAESEPVTFTVSQENDEYRFIANTEETKERYGDLTLTPIDQE